MNLTFSIRFWNMKIVFLSKHIFTLRSSSEGNIILSENKYFKIYNAVLFEYSINQFKICWNIEINCFLGTLFIISSTEVIYTSWREGRILAKFIKMGDIQLLQFFQESEAFIYSRYWVIWKWLSREAIRKHQEKNSSRFEWNRYHLISMSSVKLTDF